MGFSCKSFASVFLDLFFARKQLFQTDYLVTMDVNVLTDGCTSSMELALWYRIQCDICIEYYVLIQI